ncbi:hypothetical protein [Segatella baroniae]|uniref:hypothetical protein n=1 Tax=Segatella baroniae TaxID=305719 RepID=UPI0012DF0727|nr:hypothetical protein [Segatella baroniae]
MTGGVRRGEAGGFNTRRKASGAGTQACAPAIKRLSAATMTSISPLQLVPPHASKINWLFRRLTLYTRQHPLQT